MAKLTKLINYLESFDSDLKEEIYNREDQAEDQKDKTLIGKIATREAIISLKLKH